MPGAVNWREGEATYTAATEAGVSDIQAKSMATTASEKVKDSYGQGQQ
jgi:hypothetical protein